MFMTQQKNCNDKKRHETIATTISDNSFITKKKFQLNRQTDRQTDKHIYEGTQKNNEGRKIMKKKDVRKERTTKKERKRKMLEKKE
jgi:hypothetical protein